MKSKILKYIQTHPSHEWKARDIARYFDLDTDQRREMKKVWRELKAEGLLQETQDKSHGQLAESNSLSKSHAKSKSKTNSHTHSQPKSNLLTGLLKVHSEGYAFLIPEVAGETDVFIPARYLNGALSDDKVVATFEASTQRGKREGRVIKILERGRKYWVGHLSKRGKSAVVTVAGWTPPLEVIVSMREVPKGAMGQLVSVEITDYGSQTKPKYGQIHSIVGQPQDIETEKKVILIKHQIEEDFPSEVKVQSQKLSEHSPDFSTRVDLTELPIMTIDGATARDFDDAVAVVKQKADYHLYVSIADVAHYVKPGTPLDKEAFKRGTSVYFSDRCIPMLPEVLSNDLCSLKPDVLRPTLTAEIRYDKQGQPLEAWFYESVIKSCKRGIYENIQTYWDHKPTKEFFNEEEKKSLDAMKILAERLMLQRKQRGSIDFDLPEPIVIFGPQGDVDKIVRAQRFFSHRLIEEFMIAANVAVAKVLGGYQLPVLYRVHGLPEKEKLEAFSHLLKLSGFKASVAQLSNPPEIAALLEKIQGHPAEAMLHQALLRCMRIATYQPANEGHFGLHLTDYCHFTSPIRRYPDLIIHRQLKYLMEQSKDRKAHLVFSKKENRKAQSCYSFEQLAYIGKHSSARERKAMEAEREMLDFNRCQLAQKIIGDRVMGLIRRVTKFGLYIELEPYFIEGLLHVRDMQDDYYEYDEKRLCLVGRKRKSRIYKIGDRLPVVVESVSLEKREIRLARD